jgi:hypothetical protein
MRPSPISYNCRMPLAEDALRAGKHFPRIHRKDLILPLSGIAQTLPRNATTVRVTLCASVRGNQMTLRIGRKR